MKIDLASAHQILVELNREDLQLFDLTVEQLDPFSENTRRILQQILRTIAQETGSEYQLRQYSNVDVLPDKVGGCLLIISDCEKRQTQMQTVRCFFADEIDDLIDLSRAVCKDCEDPRITLLQTPQGFLLLSPRLSVPCRRLFAEFLQPMRIDEDTLALLQERCSVLLRDAPLSVLSGGT